MAGNAQIGARLSFIHDGVLRYARCSTRGPWGRNGRSGGCFGRAWRARCVAAWCTPSETSPACVCRTP
jgi:hypothetical protein